MNQYRRCEANPAPGNAVARDETSVAEAAVRRGAGEADQAAADLELQPGGGENHLALLPVRLLLRAAVLVEAAHRDPHHHHRPPVRPLPKDTEDEECSESTHEPEARVKAPSKPCRVTSVDGRRRKSEQQLLCSCPSAAGGFLEKGLQSIFL